MPRKTVGRDQGFETNVAEWVKRERASRGLTFERLAEAMGSVGCVIHPSALHKIEKAAPPRRITVNELVAFSSVFDVPMADLVQPPDSGDDEFMIRLAALESAANGYCDARRDLVGLAVEFADAFPELDPLRRLVVQNAMGPDLHLVDHQGVVHAIEFKGSKL